MDLVFLSRIDHHRQIFTAVDSDTATIALAEASGIDPAEGYCSRLLAGAIPAAVPDLVAHPELAALPATAILGVRGYCGVPVHLPDGTVYGTLCGLHATPGHRPDAAQLQALSTIADLIGQRLHLEQQHAADLARQRQDLQTVLTPPVRQLVLQPIVTLPDGHTTGYEALSRFTAADGHSWPPEAVFTRAAALGLHQQLELAAAASALQLLPALPEPAYVSINLSPATLLTPAAHHLLAGTPLHRVVLELTEHHQVRDYPALRRGLAPLRAAGLRLAVDDTGAGFASMRHLTHLNPEIIKLDVGFVQGVLTDPACRAITRAVAGYAAEVGALLVAEGIETAAQAATVTQLGAQLGQGYHFARPAPTHTFLHPHASAPPHRTDSTRAGRA